MQTSQLVDPNAGALASFKIAGGGRSWLHLFASHPPLEQRIAALERAQALAVQQIATAGLLRATGR